jgi:L-alanine-DL-glutamate epimerase-like enolase superfamily enzyme
LRRDDPDQIRAQAVNVALVEPIVVNVAYRHRELSSIVARDGVTDVLVRITTDDGLVGWGESTSGADAASIEAAVTAMAPFVVGRDPWNASAMRADAFSYGLWQFRAQTGNFAWAGIDMALADICGKAVGQPLWRLLGGAVRSDVTYFYYLARGDDDELREQAGAGLAAGYDVFYLKVGLDEKDDLRMVATLRDALGAGPKLRLDANSSWSLPQALRMLERLAEYDIDFVEQPVRETPLGHLGELRRRTPIAVCSNEGLWSEADAYARISGREADVFCLSSSWVGSLGAFSRLAYVAELEGLAICKHTHGELGIAAAAGQHVLLTLPNGVDGHQQTAQMMVHDVLTEDLPIATGAHWGRIDKPGLGVEVDEDAVAEAAGRYRSEGQFLPWQPYLLGREDRP